MTEKSTDKVLSLVLLAAQQAAPKVPNTKVIGFFFAEKANRYALRLLLAGEQVRPKVPNTKVI